MRAGPGYRPGSAGIARSCAVAYLRFSGPPHAARRRGVYVFVTLPMRSRSPRRRSPAGSSSSRSGQLLATWRACRRRPLGVGDFRTWLACREMVARRCTIDGERSPAYGFAELARLTGVSEKRARASVRRLVGAGLLELVRPGHRLPRAGPTRRRRPRRLDRRGPGLPRHPPADPPAPGRRRPPALIATVLGLLLRCLSRGRGGFKSRGRVKASWIARVFGVDLRRVKQARKDLIDLGWIAPEPADQWAENRWGRVYRIDLAWEPGSPTPAAGRRLPPPPALDGRAIATP